MDNLTDDELLGAAQCDNVLDLNKEICRPIFPQSWSFIGFLASNPTRAQTEPDFVGPHVRWAQARFGPKTPMTYRIVIFRNVLPTFVVVLGKDL